MQVGAAGSTALNTLLGLTRHYAGADLAALPDASALALLNRSLHEMQVWILESYDIFEFCGTFANTNTVAGTNNYAFPVDFVQINRIELNYSNGTDGWQNAEVVDLRSIPDALANLEATSDRVTGGPPIVYLLNNKLYLKYTPATSVTNGIRVYYTAIQTELTSTATDEPTLISEHFHDTLCMLAAFKWSFPRDAAHAGQLQAQIDRGHQELSSYFKKTLNVKTDKFIPRRYNAS